MRTMETDRWVNDPEEYLAHYAAAAAVGAAARRLGQAIDKLPPDKPRRKLESAWEYLSGIAEDLRLRGEALEVGTER